MSIKDYGWDEHFEREWNRRYGACMSPGLVAGNIKPGRIVADYGQMLRVVADSEELLVNRPLKGFDHDLQPVVGDWVALEQLSEIQSVFVRGVLSRKTKFSRAAAGPAVKEQIVAANVDVVFLVQSLNRDFNMKRLERYLVAAWESGAMPVVVLTKVDCCDDVADKMATVYATAPGVAVHAISCITGEGIAEIRKYLVPGKTIALLGSSGVGKSTLVNTLVGKDLLKTQEIREDDSRGRHTTTRRELLLIPGGGLIMDTPGMRALTLWEADTGMKAVFGDIEELVKLCRFRDCRHRGEPGCAVQEALETGKLEIKRWESWLKLQKELAYLEAKKEGSLRLEEKQWGKRIAKFQKELHKGRK